MSIRGFAIGDADKAMLFAMSRRSIRRNPSQLRDVISETTFESLFGVAKWSKDKRQNIFGGEDQLKVAPKGVPKDHP
jgi:hypothetical protein